MAAMSDWRSFWDSEHSIYVNALHKDVHYREMAEGIAGYVPGRRRACSTTAAARRLHAERWRPSRRVFLSDAAPTRARQMTQRFAAIRRIKVLSPEEVERLPRAASISSSPIRWCSI